MRLLKPKIDFKFHELEIDDNRIVLLEISAAFRHPVQFKNVEYIRIGSYKKPLKDYQEKERELWRIFDQTPFEEQITAENVSGEGVLGLLDYPAYFDLLESPLPESRDAILKALETDNMIARNPSGTWDILNLGAILFAKQISKFRNLKRKATRVVIYKEKIRIETQREFDGAKGYASGFTGLIGFIANLLPSNEIIGKALR